MVVYNPVLFPLKQPVHLRQGSYPCAVAHLRLAIREVLYWLRVGRRSVVVAHCHWSLEVATAALVVE
jgi:hypothetical protein